MRNLLYILTLFLSAICLSCTHTELPGDKETTTEVAEFHKVTVRVTCDNPETKARDTDQALNKTIHRLDLYLFSKDYPENNSHIVADIDENGVAEIDYWGVNGEHMGVFALANLDEDTANFLERKTLEELAEDYNLSAPIIWQAGNFDFDRIPMVGTDALYIDDERENICEIILYRIMYRIDIGNIVLDTDEQMFNNAEVYVKNIVLTNISNYYIPLEHEDLGYFSSGYSLFGSKENLTGAFGGVTNGYWFYRNSCSGWSMTKSFTMGGNGKMAESYPYVINNNYKVPARTLNITATGLIHEATCQSYDTTQGEGLLTTAVNLNQTYSFAVNKCLYAFMGRGCFYKNSDHMICEYDKQTQDPKLVIELSVDGISYFYPIAIIYPQPNTVYNIDKITIKGAGSEYSNFYPKFYAADFSISASEWTETTVSDIVTGIDPSTGTLVQ